ncbi:hypothetical protein O181_068232 [Austropuccinia psidii MF-1]|uniref:Uncharacterized protein n=1 Tax=Austropuccinia psidii MF-1 TaxID=1389203 RepID=A0A9Q3EYX2_9BASI|nr:hypothetical protein [Austropuccinia psidii MF-1]
MAPTKKHWDALDYVMGYLLKTKNNRLILQPGRVFLNLWSNASWGGDLERSRLGFMLKPSNALILWASKQQGVVALSTCTAKYVALLESTQHLVQAINQLTQLAGNSEKEIFCDNQAAVQVSINNQLRKQMRYLDCTFFFGNGTIRKHGIKVMLVPMGKMQADSLTKWLSGPALQRDLPFRWVGG